MAAPVEETEKVPAVVPTSMAATEADDSVITAAQARTVVARNPDIEAPPGLDIYGAKNPPKRSEYARI